MKNFNELRKINVNEHVERKGNLSYLSWAWAVDVLLQNDPMATWEFPEPRTYPDGSVMVFCNVTALEKTMRMQLPVMDNKNQAIKNPDARKISDATMRCLAKCIACFGIGLYIYAGEDLPSEDSAVDAGVWCASIVNAVDMQDLQTIYQQAYTACKRDQSALAEIIAAKDARKAQLSGANNG
jgi:hypothetical protein